MRTNWLGSVNGNATDIAQRVSLFIILSSLGIRSLHLKLRNYCNGNALYHTRFINSVFVILPTKKLAMKPIPLKMFREDLIQPSNTQHLLNSLVVFLAICAILYFGKDIIIPVLFAGLLSFLLAPCVRALQKIKIPKTISIIFVVVIAFSALIGLTAVVATALTNLAAELPQYESNLRQKAQSLKLATSGGKTVEKAANVLKDLSSELQQSDKTANPEIVLSKPIAVELTQTSFGPLDPVISVVGVLIHPLTQLGIVILMVVLFLFNKEDLRRRLFRLTGTADLSRTTEALDEAGMRLGKLFAAQIIVNSITGLLVGIGLVILGIPSAILWGVLTFVLRFVPYIGSLMASVFPIIIAAAVGDGWNLAFETAVLLICIEIIMGQFVEPILFGKMTGLSPIAIVASAAFWTALWGPIGLILATPLTIGLLVVGRNIESMNFLDVLLGSESALEPNHALYQRLLASDPIEAAELANAYVKDEHLDLFINDVAVPSLLLANDDHLRGVLSPERVTSVVNSFSEMLDDLLPDNEQDPILVVPTVLISPPGVLNFAATLAFSALLNLKGIKHHVLPQDAIAPGKFPDIDLTNIKWVCLCYLVTPSQAKHNYVLRRLAGRCLSAQLIGVAWSKVDAGLELQTPLNAMSIFPKKHPNMETQNSAELLISASG